MQDTKPKDVPHITGNFSFFRSIIITGLVFAFLLFVALAGLRKDPKGDERAKIAHDLVQHLDSGHEILNQDLWLASLPSWSKLDIINTLMMGGMSEKDARAWVEQHDIVIVARRKAQVLQGVVAPATQP